MTDGRRGGRRLWRVEIVTNRALADLIECGLDLLDVPMVAWREADRDRATFQQYYRSERQARALQRRLVPRLRAWADDEPWGVRVRALADEDWAESWKRHFHTTRVSHRIVIKPTWERFVPRPGDCVIELDPGMSFGTGQHATTRHCLRFLDALTRDGAPRTFLDAGCGSGILSIAAAKLGFQRVLAVDNDPVAVKIAAANLALNGVADRCETAVAGVRRLSARRRFDVIAANILADVLTSEAPRLVRLLARDGASRLLLSGMLTSQYAAVRSVYTALGLRERQALTDGDWTSGCFGMKRRFATSRHE